MAAGRAATKAEQIKQRIYSGLSQNYQFEGLGFKSSGVWGEIALKVLEIIGHIMDEQTGDPCQLESLAGLVSCDCHHQRQSPVHFGCSLFWLILLNAYSCWVTLFHKSAYLYILKCNIFYPCIIC